MGIRHSRWPLMAMVAGLSLAIGGTLTASHTDHVAAATQNVAISDFQFTSASLTIAVGDSVTWNNNGPSSHTTTSDTAGQWDSGTLAANGTFSHTFATAGTFTYHCNIHPAMKASIVVGQAAASPAAAAQASATPAPAPAADFTKFGFATVAGSAQYTPGTAATITAGGQKVVLPADFYSKPVKFELLTGTPASFTTVPAGRSAVLAFAFHVTDTASNQLVGKFDKPAQWSYTDPQVTAGSAVYDVSAATPSTIMPNSVSPGTVTGTTIAHPFIISTVGWLVTNPAGAPAAAAPVAAAPAAPGQPSALPAAGTGGLIGQSSARSSAALYAALGGTALLLVGGMAFFRQQRRRD